MDKLAKYIIIAGVTAIVLFSVSSCVNARNQSAEPTQVVPVQGADDADSAGDSDTADDQDADEPAADAADEGTDGRAVLPRRATRKPPHGG